MSKNKSKEEIFGSFESYDYSEDQPRIEKNVEVINKVKKEMVIQRKEPKAIEVKNTKIEREIGKKETIKSMISEYFAF